MKRGRITKFLLTGALLCAVVVMSFVPAFGSSSRSFAYECGPGTANPVCDFSQTGASSGGSSSGSSGSQPSAASQISQTVMNAGNFFTGGLTGSAISWLMDPVLRSLGELVLWASSWFLWAGGVALNYISSFTIINMRLHVNEIGIIGTTWKTIRDLANIFFIFALLYVAIGTILQLSGANWKNTLRNIIIAALFINFSLFFTQIIIDASNIVATGFYNAILDSQDVAGTACSGLDNYTDCGLSNIIMDKLQLVTVYGNKKGQGLLSQAGDYLKNIVDPTGIGRNIIDKGLGALGLHDTTADEANPYLYFMQSILGSIFMIVAGFIFAAVAVMLAYRFVYFIFLMILSPLAFAGLVLPRVPTKDFWKQLTSQALFAPIFFMMAWLVVKIISSKEYQSSTIVKGAIASGGFSQLMSGSPSIVGLIFNYVIIISFLVFALVLAKRTGGKGGDGVIKMGKNFQNWAVGKVGRGTLGEIGYRADKYLGNTQLGNSRPARYLRSVTTGALAEKKFGGQSRKQTMDAEKKLKQDIQNKSKEISDKATVKAGVAALETTYTAADKQQKIDQLERTLSRMNTKQLQELDAKDVAKVAEYLTPTQLDYITGERNEKYNEKEKDAIIDARMKPVVTALKAQKDTNDAKAAVDEADQLIAAVRAKPFTATYTRMDRANELRNALNIKRTAKAQLAKSQAWENTLKVKGKDMVRDLKEKELDILGSRFIDSDAPELREVRDTFIDNLATGQVDRIKNKSDAFTTTQRKIVDDRRKTAVTEVFTTADPTGASADPRKVKKAQTYIKVIGPKGVADLPDNVLGSQIAARVYNKSILQQLKRNDIDTGKATLIKDAINAEFNRLVGLMGLPPGTRPPKKGAARDAALRALPSDEDRGVFTNLEKAVDYIKAGEFGDI